MDDSDEDLQIVCGPQYRSVQCRLPDSMKVPNMNQIGVPRRTSVIAVPSSPDLRKSNRRSPGKGDSLEQMMDEYIGFVGSDAETQKVPNELCIAKSPPGISALNLDEFHHRPDYLALPNNDVLSFGTEDKLNSRQLDGGKIKPKDDITDTKHV